MCFLHLFTLILYFFKSFFSSSLQLSFDIISAQGSKSGFVLVSTAFLTPLCSINEITTSIASNEAINRSVLSKNYIYAIVRMGLIGPICEEIIFRLSIGKFIDNKYLYIIVSGLVFGYMHIMGAKGIEYLYIIPYSVLGMSFAALYKKTNNILSTITMHILHNLICVILLTI